MRNTTRDSYTAAKIQQFLVLDDLVYALVTLNKAIIKVGYFAVIKSGEVKFIVIKIYLYTAQKIYFILVFFAQGSDLIVIFALILTNSVIMVAKPKCLDAVCYCNVYNILKLIPTAEAVMRVIVKIKYVFILITLKKLQRGLKAVLLANFKYYGNLIYYAVYPASQE